MAYSNHNKLATRILAAIKASDTPDEDLQDAISINKKIQGERITKEKKSETPPTAAPDADGPKTISTSQRSFTNIADHYKNM